MNYGLENTLWAGNSSAHLQKKNKLKEFTLADFTNYSLEAVTIENSYYFI